MKALFRVLLMVASLANAGRRLVVDNAAPEPDAVSLSSSYFGTPDMGGVGEAQTESYNQIKIRHL